MIKNRLMTNYGWVQNTSNLSTIRDTVDLVPDSGIQHLELRDKIKASRKKKGDLPNRWSWDWDARCRIKAIHATGMVKLNRYIQGYELTSLGKKLKLAPKSNKIVRRKRILTEEEITIFRKGLLTNPPVIRVLELLNQDRKLKNQGLSKYDIGKELGFVGDVGFTHIDPYWVVNNGYSFNDKEGDADKWGRTILSWLVQVGWVYSDSRSEIYKKNLRLYKVLPEIDNILRYSASRIAKNVSIEMLCSDHHAFPKLVQKRRSIILKSLRKKAMSVSDIVNALKSEDIECDADIVKFEIINLNKAGLRIVESGGYYKLVDKIFLDLPEISLKRTAEIDLKERLIEENVVKYQKTIPSRYVDHLVRFGYDGNRSNEFESIVAEYFRFLGYETTYLGQGKGRVADVLAKFIHPEIYAKSYGLIIDAKAASTKYGFPAADKRKMKEYINKHGRELSKEAIPYHAFSFISSDFVSPVSPHLKEIAKAVSINGCAIRVLALLELGDRVKNQSLRISQLYNKYITNDMIKL